MRIAFLDGGTYYHHATFNDPRFNAYFCRNIYGPDLAHSDLSDIDCLYVASRQDPRHLIAARQQLLDFLAAGKLLVVMGDNRAQDWVPGVTWQATPINFWWWLTPGADSGLRVTTPDHGMFRYLELADATWHHHGILQPPPGAVSLVDSDEGGSLLYDDAGTTAGRLIVTSLDPCYHHGSYFMPATTRFLAGFLKWLAEGAPVR